MAPPKLSADAPVVNILQPVVPDFLELGRDYSYLLRTYGLYGPLSHIVHFNEPLSGYHWLYNLPTPNSHNKNKKMSYKITDNEYRE